MRKIGVFDLDGTIYHGTMTIDVAEELLLAPRFHTEMERVRGAKKTANERGSTESYWVYNKAILKTFEEILPQVSTAEVAAAAQRVLRTKGNAHYVYTASLVQQLKEEGRLLIAVSGSIGDVVNPFAKSLGFDVIVCSELEIIDGAYTGKRVRQTNKDKDKLLREVVRENDATLEDSIGVGDTHRDIPLLELTSHPIAFNPNAALFEEANKRGWKVVVERKNMVYEMSKAAGGYEVESIHPNHDGSHQEQLQ